MVPGDRIREPGGHPDVGSLDRSVGEQRDARPIDQRVVARPREQQCAVGELGRERRGHIPEGIEIVGIEVDDEPVRDERAVGGRQSPAPWRARSDAGVAPAGVEHGRGAPTDARRGARRTARWRRTVHMRRRTSRGSRTDPASTTPDHPRPVRGTPGGGPMSALRYTGPFERTSHSNLSSVLPGDPMPEILTESFCERCGTRYTFELAQPRAARPQGHQGDVARPAQLRHVGRHVDGRSDGRGAQRYRPRADRPPARRVPQDFQLLHELPAVHVRELLERRRRALLCAPLGHEVAADPLGSNVAAAGSPCSATGRRSTLPAKGRRHFEPYWRVTSDLAESTSRPERLDVGGPRGRPSSSRRSPRRWSRRSRRRPSRSISRRLAAVVGGAEETPAPRRIVGRDADRRRGPVEVGPTLPSRSR